MYRLNLRQANQRTLIIAGAIIIAVLLLVVTLLTIKYMSLQKDPQAANKVATGKVIAQVGSLYEIPTDEEPTVAQVQDKNKLSDQPFFSKAKNGDYILVYTKNKLAIIYREETKKLINVGPINTDGVAGESTDQPKSGQ